VLEHLAPAMACLALALYAVGTRSSRWRRPVARLRTISFCAGLGTVVLALSGPLDHLSDSLFSANMGQNLLLLNVAAPLLAFSVPWLSSVRVHPLGLGHDVATTIVRRRVLVWARVLGRAAIGPAGVWVAAMFSMVFWHLPGPYDMTLRNGAVHMVEHLCFLVFGILFWAYVISMSRRGSTVPHSWRIGYVGSVMLINIGLSIYLAFAQHPLYVPYARLAHRPGEITALADQQIGAGLMWSAGDLPFAIAIAIMLHRWLAQADAQAAPIATTVPGLLASDRESR